MFGVSLMDILFMMSIIVFLAGFVTFAVGVIILIRRSANRELNTIASQTAQIAQKGITDGLSGLIGNASSLINAMNDLIHTQNGVGSFLIIVGLLMVIASIGLALYLSGKLL